MLGIRLDEATERGLEAIARRTHRPKSQIAREAIQRYVARNDVDALAQQQWRRISERENADPGTADMLDAALRDFGEEA